MTRRSRRAAEAVELSQAKSDFTSEGSPPPGHVSTALPDARVSTVEPATGAHQDRDEGPVAVPPS